MTATMFFVGAAIGGIIGIVVASLGGGIVYAVRSCIQAEDYAADWDRMVMDMKRANKR